MTNPIHPALIVGTEKLFIRAYKTNEALRDVVEKALFDLRFDLEEIEDTAHTKKPITWPGCVEGLKYLGASSVTVEVIEGVASEAGTLYPLATYGWDGGNAINTKQLNLTELVSTHVEGGPCASLVKRTDQSYPGIAMHYAESEGSLTIQLL